MDNNQQPPLSPPQKKSITLNKLILYILGLSIFLGLIMAMGANNPRINRFFSIYGFPVFMLLGAVAELFMGLIAVNARMNTWYINVLPKSGYTEYYIKKVKRGEGWWLWKVLLLNKWNFGYFLLLMSFVTFFMAYSAFSDISKQANNQNTTQPQQ